MRRFLAPIVLSVILVFAGSVDAKPGGGRSSFSSGGRSSSPSSSGGRSSFSGSKPSYGSSGSSGHSSFSGGSKPAASTPSKITGKSFSNGSTDKVAGKSFSNGSTTGTSSTTGAKPVKSTYDAAAVREQKTVESRKAYKETFDKGTAPKTEYKDSKGQTVKIDPKDKKIDNLRGQLSQQKWENRELRQDNFYHAYYGRPAYFPTGIYYHDPYNPYFFFWLVDQSLETRATWLYCHRYDVDQQRYSYLVGKDAQLDARLRQLEAEKRVRDTAYTPKGVDNDLMYTSDYVDAAYNPTGKPVVTPVVNTGGGYYEGPGAFGWVCGAFVIIIIIGLVLYFVFYYRGF